MYIKMAARMNFSFRLLTFNAYDEDVISRQCSEKPFLIQMYGITEEGESVSVIAENFTPYFYVKVPDEWNTSHAQLVGDYTSGRKPILHGFNSEVNSDQTKEVKGSTLVDSVSLLG